MTTLLLVDSTVPVILPSSEMYDTTYLGNPLASVSERGVQDTSTDSLPLRVIATLDRGEAGAKFDRENKNNQLVITKLRRSKTCNHDTNLMFSTSI